LIGLLFLLLSQSSPSEQLTKLRDSYLIPLQLEPTYINKGETYLNLSVIDIKLNNLEVALKEAKMAGRYGRVDESHYLKGVIYYLLGDKGKAILNFKEIDRWKYPYFLQQMYSFSPEKKDTLLAMEILPDSLRFYLVFYEKDTNKIRDFIKNSELPLWQQHLGEGYLAYMSRKHREALNFFLESYKEKPSDYTGICILASEYWLGKLDSLLSFQKKYSIISPLAIYLKAEVLYEKDSFNLATELFLSDINSPYKTHALYGAAWGKYKLEQYSASVDLFQRFLEIYKDGELRQFALYRLARALLKQGKIKSLDYFEKIVKEYPDSPILDDTYLLLGKIHLLLDHIDEAETWFQRLISEYPDSRWTSYSYEYLGTIFFKKKDFKTALNYYSSILKLDDVPEGLIDEAHYRIEEIKWEMGRYPTRLSMYKEFIRIYPKSPRTPSLLIRIGDYYKAAARYENSVYFFRKILKDYPYSEEVDEAILALGKVYLSMGKPEKTIKLFEAALMERPAKEEEFHFELAEIYYNTENPEKAIQHYRKISSPTLLPYAKYQIGHIYFELGLFREARIPLEEIIDEFPESKYFGSAYLLLGKTYLREGSLEEAISVINQGINELSDNKKTELLSLKAKIYCQMHKEEGLDMYLKIAEMMGKDIKGTIKVLEEGLKCAKRLRATDRIEYFQKLIEVLKTHKESD